MEVVIKRKALITLEEVALYIDDLYTPGAGNLWLDKFYQHIVDFAKPNVVYATCKNKHLSARAYSCLIFNKWVVAFKIKKDKMIIYEIIHGSLLR